MPTTRSAAANRNNGYRALSVVTSRVVNSPVSQHRPRNAMTAASIRRLILAHPALYRQYRPLLRAEALSTRVMNFITRTNIGRRFQHIFRNAQIVTRHRDGSVTFILLPATYAGRYRLHPNGSITGNRAGRITGQNRGFMVANITR
jgi:hypothetical protein